jgi:hypothetical protein
MIDLYGQIYAPEHAEHCGSLPGSQRDLPQGGAGRDLDGP